MYHSIYRPGLFKGRVVIITGGGSGIGRATAHEMASLGASIALVGRKPDKLANVATELQEYGGRVSTHSCEIRDEDAVKATVDEVLAKHSKIDFLVNNAGGQYLSSIRDTTLKGWNAVVQTNLTGGFLFSREVFTQWMEGHGGSVVNMIVDLEGGVPGAAHSGAARAGMQSFTQSAAAEWATSGVRVNAIAPGNVAGSGKANYESAELKGYLHHIQRIPMQRMASESEIAACIAFLLCPAAAFITGIVLHVDGGSRNGRQVHSYPKIDKFPSFDGFKSGDLI